MLHGGFRGDGRAGYNREGQAHIPLQAMGQGAQDTKLESLPHSMSHLHGTETRRGSQWEFLIRTDGPVPSALGGGGSGLPNSQAGVSPSPLWGLPPLPPTRASAGGPTEEGPG